MNSIKILVVDDDEESRELLCEVLSSKEYAVDAVEGVTAARRELGGSGDYRIVIADLRMKDGTGLELLQDLGKQDSKPAFILMSSSMSGWERREALEMGASVVLEKPFRLGDLLRAVADLASTTAVATLP